MPRITVTLPENIHSQVLKAAGDEKESISYTVTRLIEIGLLVMNNQDEKKDESKENELEEYCQKLIIQMNGIIKELAVDKFQFSDEKIALITGETLTKFNKLKGITL